MMHVTILWEGWAKNIVYQYEIIASVDLIERRRKADAALNVHGIPGCTFVEEECLCTSFSLDNLLRRRSRARLSIEQSYSNA